MSGFPGGIANGPSQSEHLEKDARVWERPWTLEEMRQSSAGWSLAADSGLFLFLQDFSHKMLSKTHEIEKQLDGLIRDTKATDSCLHSVFSDFLMLSNTQFIENRVCDEEVEEPLPKTDAVEKQPERTREQKEAELIPKMQEAVNYGLRVLESAFEQLDIKAGNSDSEDEDVTGRVEAILEPKDLYVDRPLPYLIGSVAFMEQEDVGLGDLSSDEMSVDSDRDSVIESDDGKEATHSDDDFIQGESQLHNVFKKKSSMLSFEDDEEEEEDEDSDIFGESDKEDDDHNPKGSGPISFADELAARIRGEPVPKQEGDRASVSSKKKSKSKKEAKSSKTQAAEDDSDDMFKPPKMDDFDDDDDEDDFSPFGGSSRLFSGGKGLFDDDDEGDLFADAPKPFVPEEKKPVNENVKVATKTAETGKPGKKIPTGGVSIFPANSLFGPGSDSDSVRSKENGTPSSKVSAPPKGAPPQTPVGGGGLFDEEDEDDDFFGGKSLQKSEPVVKEKPKPKTTVDLFDEDDEDDGNIFSDKNKSTTPVQIKKEVVAEPVKPPEKKMPAGAISMFGPGTKSLLSEGLKKRRPSTSEESEKSEENGPAPEVRKAAPKPSPKPQTRGLFSDDEDTPVYPTIPRSQSKPEPTNQSNTSKAPSFLFDDDEEEDLFASAVKSKPKSNSSKTSPVQASSALTSSLFSDDEDQWLAPTATSDVKSGGMKASTSAPSGLTSTKTTPSSSLFEEEDDNDLFAQTKESSSQKKIALLFEDDDGGDDDNEDEEKGTLFGGKTNVDTNNALPTTKTLATTSESSSSQIPTSDPPAPLPTENKSVQPEKLTQQTSTSPETAVGESVESKKKPAGAVSLFGGINVLEKQTKIPVKDEEDDDDDDFPLKPSPPPFVMEENEEKVKSGAFGLFDDDDEGDDWNDSFFTPGEPNGKTTQKEEEEEEEKKEVEPPQTKVLGVLQDEEPLFSQSQEKEDNDLDGHLFATSGKAESPPKAAANNLFAEDDEDDLFSSPKPKVPPIVAEKPSKPADKAPLASPEPVSETEKPAPGPVKPKDSSSRIGKLQASLKINPAAMLPGAVPTLPGAINVIPGMDPSSSSSGVSSSSLSPSPVTTPVGAQTDSEGVNFETPVQVTTLQSVQKSRTKGAGKRRPQSRAARQKAVQRSVEDGDSFTSPAVSVPNPSLSDLASHLPDRSSQTSNSSTLSTSSTPTVLADSPLSQPTVLKESPRPSVLSLPQSNDAKKKESNKPSGKALAYSEADDIFASDILFEATSVTNTPPTVKSTTKTESVVSGVSAAKKDKDKSTFQSIFDDDVDDLFQPAKPRSTAKKAKQSTFLEDDDDDEDIFGVSNSSTPSSTSSKEIKNGSFSKQEIFQDEVTTMPKVQKKHKEKPLDFSLFDDDTDIFADLTDTYKPKQKVKTKPEAKSIFDDDMDDIFSSSKAKTVTKASHKPKKAGPAQETTDSSNIFDDPLNALGGT